MRSGRVQGVDEVPEVVVVGAASRDLDAEDPRGWRLGGGVTYSSWAAVRLGVSVGAVMGLDPISSGAHEVQALARAGVRIHAVPIATGPVFENRSTAGGREQVAHGASEAVPANALPRAWADACAVILNPVAGEIGPDWAGAVSQSALVGLDCQGLVRRLVPGRRVEALPLRLGPLVARADLISLSAEDAVGGAPPFRDLLTRDGQEVIFRSGEKGSLRLYRDGATVRIDRFPVIPAVRHGDGTGAGDSFLAAWLVGRLALRAAGARDEDARAIHLAALAATLIVEGKAIDRESVRRRSRDVTPPIEAAEAGTA
jgi:sugar/nucleoside kinase (ribokinase family)